MKYSIAIILGILCALIYFESCHGAEMDLTKAVIHHTASPDVSAETIDSWHKQRGWDGIGYHWVIREDGTIEGGRSKYKRGAHARGRNDYVGIVLTGYDTFKVAQYDSLMWLLKKEGITHIERHHEFCPSDGINIEEIQKVMNK